MRQHSVPPQLTRPVGWSGAAAVTAGAAIGAPVGALAEALLALVVLPMQGQGTRRREHAAHRPAATTTAAARLVWLAIAAALGRWLAEAVLNPQMELEGVVWLALLPVLVVGIVVLLLRPATGRDFQAGRQGPGTRAAG